MSSFDERAAGFDTARRIERANKIAREIGEKSRDYAGKSAMEFGCGTGLVGMNFIEHFSHIIFIDSSAGMIEQVQRKLKEGGIGAEKADVLCVDITSGGGEGLRFDCIFSALVLHHIGDVRALLAKLRGMLNPGGALIVVDLDSDIGGRFHAEEPDFCGHDGFAQAEFALMAEAAGFGGTEIGTFYSGIKEIEGKDVGYSLFVFVGRNIA